MQNIADFQNFFKSELIELLQPLEVYRIKRIRIFKWIQFAAILTIIILIACIIWSNLIISVLCGFLVIAAEGFAFESLGKTNEVLARSYKSKIIPIFLNFINPQHKYIPEQKVAKNLFEKSLLFPHEINEVHGEDYMRFTFDEVDIMFCESEVTGYGPGLPMFKGIFIASTFNKPFSSQTFIFPKKATSFFRKLRFKIYGSSYHVQLEDPEFEREFIVLSDNQIESRYILTTSLMQRLLDYKRKLKAELAFSFISNRLYCTIPNAKNLFEPALFDSFLDFKFIFQSYEPIMLYSGIVEDLNLNLKIWSE
jgi:hypothetical protein